MVRYMSYGFRKKIVDRHIKRVAKGNVRNIGHHFLHYFVEWLVESISEYQLTCLICTKWCKKCKSQRAGPIL
jgi:hypothetical protein